MGCRSSQDSIFSKYFTGTTPSKPSVKMTLFSEMYTFIPSTIQSQIGEKNGISSVLHLLDRDSFLTPIGLERVPFKFKGIPSKAFLTSRKIIRLTSRLIPVGMEKYCKHRHRQKTDRRLILIELQALKHGYSSMVECPCVGHVDTRTHTRHGSDTCPIRHVAYR